MRFPLALPFFAVALHAACAAAPPPAPTGLLVDLLAMPEKTTIASEQPSLGWIYTAPEGGAKQAAYELVVSSSPQKAAAGEGDVWASGKVESPQSLGVEYAGPPLERGGKYAWCVRVWDAAGGEASPWSAPQSFAVDASGPAPGARSVYRSSGNPFAGRYRPAFDTEVCPVKVTDKGGGRYFLDFGRAGFGYLALKLDGKFSGKSVEVRFGEKAKGDEVDMSPGGSIRASKTSVPLADGAKTYEARPPKTTFPGFAHPIDVTPWAGDVTPFRYAEVFGAPVKITADNARQMLLHVPFDDRAASFRSSNPALDAVWGLCAYSIKATSFCGAYVDGDRERTPYEADAYINQLGHYGTDREYTTARYTYEYLLDHPTWPTEWRLHFPLMAWSDYLYTGDKRAMEANYDSLKKQLFLDWERPADGLFQSRTEGDPRDIVDWPANERDGYELTPMNTVVNAFHYNALRLMAKIAGALGKEADRADFTARAERLRASFDKTFWDGSKYKDGEKARHASAHANFFPLALGLVPPERVRPVVSFLKTKRMAPSVYGAQYLLEGLFESGEDDYALALMADNSPGYERHWWNMMKEGSTVTMEAWGAAAKPNLDWNHAWGAAPANIIPRYVLGVRPLEPGFGRIEIAPHLGTGSASAGLTKVEGRVPTVRGPVTVSAANSPASFQLLVETPGNTVARVLVPTKGLKQPALICDGKVVAAPVENGRLVLDGLGPGRHAIWLSATAAPAASVLQANLSARGGAAK